MHDDAQSRLGLECRADPIVSEPDALELGPLVLAGGWIESELGVERSEDDGTPGAVPINEPYIPHHLTPPLFGDRADGGDFAAVTLNEFRHGQPDYLFSERYADVWRPRLRLLVLARLHAQARRLERAFSLCNPLVVVKEPNGSMGADFVSALHPRSRLLFLLRDGRDVVDSMVDAQEPGGWLERTWASSPGDPAARRLELVRRESILWLARTRAAQKAYEARPEQLRTLVRYEELLADPSTVLRRLDSWLGMTRTEAERQAAIRRHDFHALPAESRGRGKQHRAASPGSWRQNLSPDEQQVMDDAMGEKLRDLGYR